MTIDSSLNTLAIASTIALFSILPFIFKLKKKTNNNANGLALDNITVCYLIVLGLLVLGLIIIKSIETMGLNTSSRALLLCSVLLVACLDRLIDLSNFRARLKSSLTNTLHYFVLLLCAIPVIWQLFIMFIPNSISSQLSLLTAAEFLLIIILLILGIVKRPVKAH